MEKFTGTTDDIIRRFIIGIVDIFSLFESYEEYLAQRFCPVCWKQNPSGCYIFKLCNKIWWADVACQSRNLEIFTLLWIDIVWTFEVFMNFEKLSKMWNRVFFQVLFLIDKMILKDSKVMWKCLTFWSWYVCYSTA